MRLTVEDWLGHLQLGVVVLDACPGEFLGLVPGAFLGLLRQRQRREKVWRRVVRVVWALMLMVSVVVRFRGRA